MFRLVHAERDGLLLLHEDVAGLVMAGALLGELVLSGHLTISADHMARVLTRLPPADALGHIVIDHLTRETHPVPIWLPFLAGTAYAQVADRMIRSGHVEQVFTRRLFVRRTGYLPADGNNAAWPWARLLSRLERREPLDTSDRLLGGLLLACDWHRTVLRSADLNVSLSLRHELQQAPGPVQLLAALTEAAVRSAVTSHLR
ncbi:Golgi phosphoprotein 3 (GPP34) [Actinoplanes regularis]|uniref:Golgi phosphoprotein 3 (GPP34) n=1 Tax=Actinoplanes regularis TaxID=52697 RepID=A0A239IW60_9ACTN|nr:Golgi phosphoprotein 3 (GPP34) [Actinoplanes regularis]